MAWASICLTRSLVTPIFRPTSSRVYAWPSNNPYCSCKIRTSRGGRLFITSSKCSRNKLVTADSSGGETWSSSMRSPKTVSFSSSDGVSRESGRWSRLKAWASICLTLSRVTPIFRPTSSNVYACPSINPYLSFRIRTSRGGRLFKTSSRCSRSRL